MLRKKIAIDLFSGCGGMTLGLKQAGFLVIGAVDIDKISVETYKKNHPEVFIWNDDINKINILGMMRELNIEAGKLDLLAGCPPCQGFSKIRAKKNNVDDERNDLIFKFLNFVEVLKPKVVMLENVPNIIKNWRLRVFENRLLDLGYIINSDILNAADYAVPQRRLRYILIGSKFGKIEFAQPEKDQITVKEAIGNLLQTGESGDCLHDMKINYKDEIKIIISLIPKNGGSRRELGKEFQLNCHKNCTGYTDVYGRMNWDKVAPTITGGCIYASKGRFIHPEEDRSITLREAALLQSFPLNYYFSLNGGMGSAAAMIGNALPPEFVRRNATNIINFLNQIKN